MLKLWLHVGSVSSSPHHTLFLSLETKNKKKTTFSRQQHEADDKKTFSFLDNTFTEKFTIILSIGSKANAVD